MFYIVREDIDVPAACPPQAIDQPYSEERGYIEGDLIRRSLHTHGLYRDDRALVYYKLEEATRGASYADSIRPLQQRKDGRAGFVALTSQYAGAEKWEYEIRRQDNLLHTWKWKGQANFTLERFIHKYCNALVSIQACSRHT